MSSLWASLHEFGCSLWAEPGPDPNNHESNSEDGDGLVFPPAENAEAASGKRDEALEQLARLLRSVITPHYG